MREARENERLSQQEIPPWLREQLARLEQLQQNLQAVQMQNGQSDGNHRHQRDDYDNQADP